MIMPVLRASDGHGWVPRINEPAANGGELSGSHELELEVPVQTAGATQSREFRMRKVSRLRYFLFRPPQTCRSIISHKPSWVLPIFKHAPAPGPRAP